MIGEETQAEIARDAALLMGVDSNRIAMLTTPLTTSEEAAALAQLIPTSAAVVLVTDAIHMPRAKNLFEKRGFHPIAAPTNFKVTSSPRETRFK